MQLQLDSLRMQLIGGMKGLVINGNLFLVLLEKEMNIVQHISMLIL